MTQKNVTGIADFIARYLSYMLGAGVHTSRVVRNSKRIGSALGVGVSIHTSQKTATLTVSDAEDGIKDTRVIDIPAFPISFEWNADLSALSWAAHDRQMTLEEIESRFDEIVARPKMNPVFVLFMASLANASFCRLFGGDWLSMGIVLSATITGMFLRQRMQANHINHYVVFAVSAFVASLCASTSLIFDTTSEIALATSVLYLIPGVPLINGIIDIVEGETLIGCSRLISAFLLIICIAIGMSFTLMLVKNSLI